MAIIYEASTATTRNDHGTLSAAVEAIEAAGHGSVTQFIGHQNLHGGTTFQSCASWVFDGGKWFDIDIWSGYGDRTPCDRPC